MKAKGAGSALSLTTSEKGVQPIDYPSLTKFENLLLYAAAYATTNNIDPAVIISMEK